MERQASRKLARVHGKKVGARGAHFARCLNRQHQPRQDPGRYLVRVDEVAGVVDVEPQTHL
jgi:hypothetical protein